MASSEVHCLIGQTACGRKAGNPVCLKCGMDERVVYPGQADLATALEAARARYVAAHEAAEPPPPPEPPEPPTPPKPPPQPSKQHDPEHPATPGTEKRSVNRIGLGVLVMALLGGGWWWKDQQDQRLQQAEEQAAGLVLAAEQARSEREAEKQRADEAEAQRVTAEKAQAQIAKLARREREAEKKRADEAEILRVAAEKAQVQIAEQARREREAEKKRTDEAEILRVAAEKAQAQIAEQARREREADKLRVDKVERATLLHDRYQISADGSEVRDVQTGLVWARCSVGQRWNGKTCSGEARSLINDRTSSWVGVGGGWRMPTVRELMTLVFCSSGKTRDWIDPKDGSGPIANYCVNETARPTIRSDVFVNTPATYFWTSSPDVDHYSWYVNFGDGNLGLAASFGHLRNENLHVRLVRDSR